MTPSRLASKRKVAYERADLPLSGGGEEAPMSELLTPGKLVIKHNYSGGEHWT
jgi:hypothetical protein